MKPLLADLTQYITIGDLFSFGVICAFFVYLFYKQKSDTSMRIMQAAVDEIKEMNTEHDKRIRMTEDAIVRLTALQETHAGEIKLLRDSKHELGNIVAEHSIDIRSIKERHERADQHEFIEKRRNPRT